MSSEYESDVSDAVSWWEADRRAGAWADSRGGLVDPDEKWARLCRIASSSLTLREGVAMRVSGDSRGGSRVERQREHNRIRSAG